MEKINANFIIKDLKDSNNIINRLLKINVSIDFSKLTIAKSHGDFGIVRLIYGKEITVINLAIVMELPVAYEVIRSYACVDKYCFNDVVNIDNLILYVKEFLKYVCLNKYDLKYMAYIYLYKLDLSSYGYKQYIKRFARIW